MPIQGARLDPTRAALVSALRKFVKTSACPKYLSTAVNAWLAAHPEY